MSLSLDNLITEWDSYYSDEQGSAKPDYKTIQKKVEYAKRKLFDQFAPTQTGHPPFDLRLESWLSNLSDPDQMRLLFELIPQLFFVGRDEIDSLCRHVFVGPFTWWFYECSGLSWESLDLVKSFESFAASTWFCPLTDSFPIAHFCHLNGLSGQTHRPDWRSLQLLGDQSRIRNYMAGKSLDRIALLEDFIGSGTQMRSAVKFAAEISPNTQILLAPLVTTFMGDEVAREACNKHPNLTYHPSVVLSQDQCLAKLPGSSESQYRTDLRSLLETIHPRLGAFTNSDENNPLGFKGNGALTIMFSNCPSNVPPAIHKSSPDWQSLFPRVSRS